MAEKPTNQEKRKSDPYLDRRSGDDRRDVYDIDYFAAGGAERRDGDERRQSRERRKDCVRITKWTSVCTGNKPKQNQRLSGVRATVDLTGSAAPSPSV